MATFRENGWVVSDTEPRNPYVGERWWNPVTKVVKVCTNAVNITWSQEAAAPVSFASPLTTSLSAAGVLTVDIADIARADLATESKPYGIELYTLRQADMAAMGISETAGDHFIDEASNVFILKGEVTDNETEASVSWFSFTLPAEYIDAGTVTVNIAIKRNGGEDVGVASTIDLEAYKQATAGTVGTDICATDAISVTGTAGVKAFTVTPTGLVAGDRLNFKLTTSIVDDAGGTTGQAEIYSIQVACQVKG